MDSKIFSDTNGVELLIAEDSITQAEQLKHLLLERGFTVHVAQNGRAALTLARKHKPAVIISDIVMPEMDGYALCRAIRTDESLKETPVILLTSLSSPRDVIEALKCGADNFIRKPYDEKHLLLRLEHIIANRRLRASDKVKVGVELYLGGDKHFITAERQQILDLLISTYEQAVQLCEDLKVREERLARTNKIISGIYQISKSLNVAVTEADVIAQVLQRTLGLPDIEGVWIELLEETNQFRVVADSGLSPMFREAVLRSADCECRRMLLSGEMARAVYLPSCERFDPLKKEPSKQRSHVSVPLRLANRVLGLLNLVPAEGIQFDDEDLTTLNGIGNQIGSALQRARVMEKLEAMVEEKTRALRESELWFRTVFQSQEDAVFVISPDRRVLNMNAAAERMFRCSLDEVKDRSTEVFHVDYDHFVEFGKRIWEAFAQNRAARFEFKLKRKSGELFPTEHTVSQLKSEDDQMIGIVSVVRDISERKKAEEERRQLELQFIQAQKLESIGSLAAGIAHDFNNVLGIILGHASILQRLSGRPETLPASIDAITKAVNRGAGVVRQLLAFARKGESAAESVLVNEVINELVKMLQETFPKTVIIETQLDSTIPPITADSSQLYQTFLNLAINSRDAMPEGGTIKFSTTLRNNEDLRSRFPDASANTYICINIEDTGMGMDEETQRRIFEPFYTTKEPGKGTGLGMAVVYGVVTGLGGFIDVNSVRGKGTIFSLYLPVKEKESRDKEKRAHEGDAPGGNETILVVEDEEMLRELVVAILSSKGYRVLTAVDGAEALAEYEKHRDAIALVLSDVGLPRLDGLGLLKELKAHNPQLKYVIASGYLEPAKKEEMVRLGVTTFADKPYRANDLLWKIREAVEKKP